MAQQAYGGPTSLAFSKHASPITRRAMLSTVPPAVSSYVAPPSSTIATREQIAASHNESAGDASTQNSDAQLAVAQGNALKDEVDKHAAKFSRTMSSAVTNTRRLLELIREAVQKEDPTGLQKVDELWAELEQLFAAANGAKDALPNFLEKQRNNMALYHGSVVNETYRESQEELNLQNKKINLQHGLILEHQQAFQDYKAKTASKLNELEELQERVSRLTLEKGHFRGEIDKYAKLLEEEQATKAEDLKKAKTLQKELETLTVLKTQLHSKVESQNQTVSELQDKIRTTEQQITERFATELQEKSNLLSKEYTKTANLNTLINTLKTQESNAKQDLMKAKAETKAANEKYSRMATEHSQTFQKSNEQIKKIETLTAEVERLRKDGADMTARLAKLSELEKSNTILFNDKANLLEQIGTLSIELKEAKDNCVKINKELANLTEKLAKVQKENDNLKIENSDLVSKQTALKATSEEAKQAVQAAYSLKKENAQLKAKVSTLQAGQAAPVISEDQVALKQKVKDLEDQEIKLKEALEEWTGLAKRSYKEYKDMLPAYKKSEQLRQAVSDKEDEIKNLKLQLSDAKTAQSNGVGTGGDAAYWKNKYDGLLSTIGG